MADQKFKSKVRLQGGVALPTESINRALSIDANGELKSSVTTDAELAHLSGVTSNVQSQITDAQADATQALADAAAAQADATQALADAAAAQATADAAIPSSEKGVALGVATLDGSGKVPVSQLPSAIMTYEGVWNASTNSPSLADGSGDAGMVYRVGTAGSQNLGSGSISFEVGDYVIYNGSIWEKSDTTDAVASVFGRTGIVSAQSGDYSASQITNTPAGSIAATDVQAAINELDGDVQAAQADATQALADAAAAQADIDAHIAQATGAHAATAISIADVSSQFTSANVEGALDEAMDAAQAAQADATQALADAAAAQADVDALEPDVADLITLSGVAANSSDLGTFTGTIIPDASTIKAALQALETEVEAMVDGSAGDIAETSFSITNNQASPASITGLAFSNSAVRSFKVLLSVEIDATLDLFESFELIGINKAGSFEMAQSAVGDESGIVLSITAAGQVQYTSANYSGFVSGAIKFRAITTSI
jgi:multidrug efflux pump subunit AcrA (membrane-fusion protein)